MCRSNRSGFAVRVKLHFLAISILVYENSIVVEMQLAPILESNLTNATTTCSVRHDSVSIVLRIFYLLRNKLHGIGALNLGAGASRFRDCLFVAMQFVVTDLQYRESMQNNERKWAHNTTPLVMCTGRTNHLSFPDRTIYNFLAIGKLAGQKA